MKTHFGEKYSGETLCGRIVHGIDVRNATEENLMKSWSGADAAIASEHCCRVCYSVLLARHGTEKMRRIYNA